MVRCRTKTLINNTFFSVMLQVVTFTAGLITPRLILANYGSEVNGLILSINQFISYFNLVEAGLASSAVYALFKPLANELHDDINAILSATNRYYKLSGYIFVSLTIGMAVIYPIYVKSSVVTPLEVGLLVLILGMSGTLSFFVMAKYRALLTADQKQYILSISSIIAIVLNTIIITMGACAKLNIVLLRFICLISIFSPTLILLIYVKNNYKYIDYSVEPNNGALESRWVVLINEIFGTIHFGCPLIIITLFMKLTDVSVYSVYDLITKGIFSICGFLVLTLSASFGEVIARNIYNIFQKAYDEFEFLYYAANTWIYGCAIVLTMSFVRVYTGGIKDANYNIAIVGFLFVLKTFLSALYSPQAILVRAGGLFKEVQNQTIVQALITLIVGVVLTIFYGLIGTLISSIIANIYRIVTIIPATQGKLIPTSIKTTIKRLICSVFALAIICIPFDIGINPGVFNVKLTEITNYIQWIKYAVVVGVFAIFVVIVVNLIVDQNTMFNTFKRMKNLFNFEKRDG